MAKRARIQLEEPKSSYFVDDKKHFSFVHSGCTLFDCVLGGGYPLGRITNIVGDKSTAKTALATEAMINFNRAYPKGVAAYRDTESAFDRQYAAAMGLKIKDIDFGNEDEPVTTVEAFMRDFDQFLDERLATKTPGIYVVDSLDALSDEEEMDSEVGKQTYGTKKAKALSIFFRKTAYRIEQSKVLLLVISQVRDAIGVMFGEKHKRSGGRALDFYASQIVWLAHIEQLKRKIKGIERPYGVTIRANCKKNKVGLPLRKCDFDFLFGYGIDDVAAGVWFLDEIGQLGTVDLKKSEVKPYLASLEKVQPEEYEEERRRINKAVKRHWREIETEFLPKRAKYA